jgi:hypothetical protein
MQTLRATADAVVESIDQAPAPQQIIVTNRVLFLVSNTLFY